MADLVFEVPGKVIFGTDSIRKLGNEISRFGERFLLITEGALNEWHYPDKISSTISKSGCKCLVHAEISVNSTTTEAEKAVLVAKRAKVHGIIGLGGVHTLGIAKSVAALALSSKGIYDCIDGGSFPTEILPYIEIPTTCRNPFMFSGNSVLVDARNRFTRVIPFGNNPSLVVIDPSYTVTLSAKYTAMTMLDTFLSSIEGLVSMKSTFLSDSLFLRSLKSIASSINQTIAQPENLTYRETASQAGFLTALGLSMSSPGIGSGLSHAISGKYQIPQSWIASVLLPQILELHLRTNPEKLARVYDILDKDSTNYGQTRETGTAVEMASLAVDAIRHLVAKLRLPMRLSNFDLTLEDLFSLADTGRQFPGVDHMPVPISIEDIYSIIEQAF